MVKKDFKQIQKKFYDGHHSGYDPYYSNLENLRNSVESQIGYVKNLGIFGYSLKGVKTGLVVDSLGFKKGDLVLDIGCSTGNLLNKLNIIYSTNGVGIDISKLAILRGTQVNPYENGLIVSDAEELPFRSNSFDYVLSFDLLEHLPNPEKCISEIARVLKRDGTALIYAVSKKDKYTWHWMLKKITFGKFGVFGDTIGGHDQEKFLYATDVVSEMKCNNLYVGKVIYFHSLFTLAYDENMPRIMSLLYKIYSYIIVFKSKKDEATREININNSLADSIGQSSNSINYSWEKVYASFLRFILPVLEFIDKIISSRGYSNGFYVLSKKK